MLSVFDKVRLGRQFIVASGRSITAEAQAFASLLTPRNFSKTYVNTPVYAPRGVTERLWRASAVLAHAFKAGVVAAATPPSADRSGRINLTGVVVAVPRSEWPQEPAGTPFIGVAIRLEPKTCGAVTAAQRQWQLICPLERDDQVYVFSESRLLNFLSSSQCSSAEQAPSMVVPTPLQSCRPQQQPQLVTSSQPPQQPSSTVRSQEMPSCRSQVQHTSAGPQAAPAIAAPILSSGTGTAAPAPRVAIVLYGLGSRCDATDQSINQYYSFNSPLRRHQRPQRRARPKFLRCFFY